MRRKNLERLFRSKGTRDKRVWITQPAVYFLRTATVPNEGWIKDSLYFMPRSSSATIEAGGFMTSKTSAYYMDRHLLLGTLYTLVGLAGVWLLASYLSAIQ
jgi:uncharacterized iron-regulated membrane protein